MEMSDRSNGASPELWLGTQRLKEYEERLLMSLQRDLTGVQGDTLILGGLYMGRRQLDALVLRNKRIYIIEAKNIEGPVRITDNATYRLRSDGSDGDAYPIGFRNQCYDQFYTLVDWFRQNGDYVLGIEKAFRIVWKRNQFLAPGQVRWSVQMMLVFWPEMHPDTGVELNGHPIKVCGYAEAVEYIKKHPCQGISLNHKEMHRMVKTLSLREAPQAVVPIIDTRPPRAPEEAQRQVGPGQDEPEIGQEPPPQPGDERGTAQPTVEPEEVATIRKPGRAMTRPHARRRSRGTKRCRAWWTGWIAAVRAAVYAFRLRLAREHLLREHERARREIDRIGKLERKLGSLTGRPRAAAL
jgi:hypothetical protein